MQFEEEDCTSRDVQVGVLMTVDFWVKLSLEVSSFAVSFFFVEVILNFELPVAEEQAVESSYLNLVEN